MPEDKQTIGGANFSEISGSEIHTGDIDASVQAGGDIVGGDKVTQVFISQQEQPGLFVGVPALPNQFVGRAEEMADLSRRLTAGETLALATEGLGGVGKTTLAVALAHHRQVLDYFKEGVLWASLGPQAEAPGLLAGWAEALGRDISALISLEERREAVKALIGQRRLLLVIDDAWELEAARALRCGGPNCCHLLTTRNRGLARAFAGVAQTQGVSTLDEEAAYELLAALAPEACGADPAGARALSQAVGGLPLALELLGGYLAAPERMVFPDLSQAALAELAEPERRLRLAQQRLGSRGGEVSLEETLGLSLADLPAEVAGAFYALGAFAAKPERFSRAAAEAVSGVGGTELALLVARNLVEAEGESLALHQVVAEVARRQGAAGAVERHRAYYLGLANEDRAAWRQIEAAYGQMKWAWQGVSEDEARLEWLWALRTYQHRRGLWRDQLAWYQSGLEAARRLGLRQAEGTILNDIGLVYDNLGQRQQALEYYQQVLPIYEEVDYQWGLAATLNNIGLVYARMGQSQKALDYYQQALPITEEVGNRAGLAATLDNIGQVYARMGQSQKALEYYQQALPIREEVGDRRGLAVTLNNIGLVYNSLGQRQQALEYYQQALPIYEEVGDRAEQATTLSNIGLVYANLGQGQQALDYYQKALPITEEVGDRAGLAGTLNNIGAVYNSLGQRQQALDYYQQALPITEEVGDRAGESVTRYNMALLYRAKGRLAEAVAELRRVVELDRLVQHPDLESDMAMLAKVEGELRGE